MPATLPTELAAKCAAAASAAAYQTREALDLKDARNDARKDRASDGRPLRTSDLLAGIRAERDRLTSEQLIRRATDAAALSLRGAMYSRDDRADCTQEIIGHVMARTDGNLPVASDSRADLSHLRGMAQNFRRSLDRRRAAHAAADAEAQASRATTWQIALDAVEDIGRPLNSPQTFNLAIDRAQDARKLAAESADHAVRALHLSPGGAVWSVFYQWARDLDGAECARECGVSPSTWRTRLQTGGLAMRAAYPDPMRLVADLTGAHVGRAADGTVIYARADERVSVYRTPDKLTPRPREGTDAGMPPTRPVTREDAIALCAMRHQAPVYGLAAIGRSATRRGHWASATVTADGRRMYWHTGGIDARAIGLGAARSEDATRAALRRSSLTASMRPGTRERSVHYVPNTL